MRWARPAELCAGAFKGSEGSWGVRGQVRSRGRGLKGEAAARGTMPVPKPLHTQQYQRKHRSNGAHIVQ